MSAVCRTRTNSFDEMIRVLITEDNLTENKYLEEFAKYDIEKEFWKLCEQQFGFSMDAPNLEKLVITMFVTYADRYIDAEMPKSWKKFISYKSGEIDAEVNESKKAIQILGGKLTKVEKFQLTGTDIGRSFVIIKKKKPTGKKFPRKAGLPSKEPLK